MHILVFGASGQSGHIFTQAALNKGFQVTAFVRSKDKLAITHPALTVIEGDATVKTQVSAAITTQDAVVSCLGGSGLNDVSSIQNMTRNIVEAMQEKGVKRLVQMSSAGVHNELEGFFGKIVGFMLRHVLKDHRAAFEILQKSTLDYTLIRPMGLTDTACTGVYRTTETGIPKGGRQIARADVAHLMLQVLEEKHGIRKSIAIAY